MIAAVMEQAAQIRVVTFSNTGSLLSAKLWMKGYKLHMLSWNFNAQFLYFTAFPQIDSRNNLDTS